MRSTARRGNLPVVVLASALLALLTAGCDPVPLPSLRDSLSTQTADKGIIWARTDRGNKDVILLVHGWNGDKISTWSALSRLFLTDEYLAEFDVATFGYWTGCSRAYPAIEDIARDLATFVDTELQRYDRIHIVAHSLGGLVARRYIVDVLEKRGRGALKVEHLLLLGTPNEGARWYISFFGSLFCGNQASQARRTSIFISDLRTGWIKHVQNGGRADIPEANRKNLPTLTIVASDDLLVESRSASSYFEEYDVKTSHTDIKELTLHTDKTYEIITNVLRSTIYRYSVITDWKPADWKPDDDLYRYLRNWRESVRSDPAVVLKSHATTTRWTYIFKEREFYVIIEKTGRHLANRGVAQSMLKIGISYSPDLAYDEFLRRTISPRIKQPAREDELPYYEVDIGETFDLLFAFHGVRGKPFCASNDPYAIISATNNSDIVERYEVAIYAESAPSDIRAYYFDDAYVPWLVSSGDSDEQFTKLSTLKSRLARINANFETKIDVSKLRHGRIFTLPMRDTRDTYLVKFSCDIFPHS